MNEFNLEEAVEAATDETVRNALVSGVTLGSAMSGHDWTLAEQFGREAGQVFDGWLAKRDMDIYDQAHAHGFMEGSGK